MFEIGRLWRDRQQENVKNRKTAFSGKKGKITGRLGSDTSGSAMSIDFAEALEEADARLLDENLELFMGEVMKQGERLKQSPNKREFLLYKAMISRFLKKIIERSFKTGRTRRRDREYVFADIIDEKLVELGHYLLLEEADTVALAATIDEIKGLLYDSLKASKGEQ
jgi:uncharacterized protein YaaR (DUF327 family)